MPSRCRTDFWRRAVTDPLPDSEAQNKALHILIIEDDNAHVELCLRAFRDDPGRFRVSVAKNLRAAREILGTAPPDLIISDWLLPDGKGLDILPRTDGNVTIPLIIMTSHGDESIAVEIMKSGAIDYVVKSATLFHDLPRIALRALRYWENIQERKRAEATVKESENRLSLALSGSDMGMWELSFPSLTGFIDSRAAAILGYPLEGIWTTCLDWDRLSHPDDVRLIHKRLKDYLEGRTPMFESEHRMKHASGEWIWVVGRGKINLRSPDGSPLGISGTIQDISARKKMEQALYESEKKYRFLIEHVQDVVWQTSLDLTFTFLSPSVETLTGYPAEELIGTSLVRLLSERSAAGIRELVSRRMEAFAKKMPASPTVFEIELRRRDGSLCWAEVSSNLFFGPDNAPAGFQGISRDITGRKQSEEAIRESEYRFRELFSNMRSGVAIYQPVSEGKDFIIRDVNRAVERIERVRKEDITGRSILEIFPGVVEFGLFEVLQRVAATGTPEEFPVSMYKDNRISGWRDNFVYRLPSGEVVALYEDVTEKKQAEEAAASAREWLGIALRAAKAGTWDWDFLTGKLTWSPEFFELFGMQPGTPATFESWRSKLHPDDREPAMAKIEQSVRDHTYLWNEYRIILPDGTIRWIGAGGSTIYNPAGEPLRMSGVCIDITEKKVAEERLLLQSQILDQMHEGVCMVRAGDNSIAYTNPRFNIMFGYTPGELDGREISVINAPLPDQTPEEVAETIRAQMIEKGIWNGEVLNIRKDGTTVHCQASIIAFVHPQFGQVWISVQDDITDRKQAEEKLRQSEQFLRQTQQLTRVGGWEILLPSGEGRWT
ncbi:MAG: PAS domain S-box protein, partial [Methanomicrobiales archaeon]|nr:PAS domain S-box protein [Methanomicrobiales archaeon]